MYSLAVSSYIAGILTILAPCVLPILPIILAGGISSGSKWYPYIITLSLAVSVVLFTVALKVSTIFIDIPSSTWKYISGGLLILLSGTYLLPHIWAGIGSRLGMGRSSALLDTAGDIQDSTYRAIMTGAALGPVFSTCSPTYTLLLATVFPVSLGLGILYTGIYALGLCTILLGVVYGGRRMVGKLLYVSAENGIYRRILGCIFLVVGISICTGLDKTAEIYILSRIDIGQIETQVLEYIGIRS